MVYLPLYFLTASGLLARTTFALPVPIVTGQVFHVAASQTLGEHHEGHGANIAHPHIVLGHENGNVVLAPVTHAPDEKNGPFMKHAGDLHPNLEGNVLLHHVTADPANIPQNPSFGGLKVNPGAIEQINEAKLQAAVEVHAKAGDAHIAAAKSHESAAKAQDEAAKQYVQNFKNTGATAKDHRDKANEHRDAADAHWTEGLLHHSKAALPGGPITYPDYAKAQASKDAASHSSGAAKQSEEHAKATTEHIKAGVANYNTGHQVQGFQHLQEAQKHAPSSPAKPNAEKSHHAAKESRKQAEKGKH